MYGIFLVLLMIIGMLSVPVLKTARAEEDDGSVTEPVPDTEPADGTEENRADETVIEQVSFTLEAPACGMKVKADEPLYDWSSQTPQPVVTINDTDAHYHLDDGEGETHYAYWVDDEYDLFTGTYEPGQAFYAVIYFTTEEGWIFSDDTQVNIDGSGLTIDYSGTIEGPDFFYVSVTGTVSDDCDIDDGVIRNVSLTITPPKCNEKVTVEYETVTYDNEEYTYIKDQTPRPEVKLPSDAIYEFYYYEDDDGNFVDDYAYWTKNTSTEEAFEPFEGTYKGGDTFYAEVYLIIEYQEDMEYIFAEDLTIDVKGATCVDYIVNTYGYNELLIMVKGTVDACEVEKTPDPPIVVPKTGIEGSAFPSFISCIGILGLCMSAAVLNKKR